MRLCILAKKLVLISLRDLDGDMLNPGMNFRKDRPLPAQNYRGHQAIPCNETAVHIFSLESFPILSSFIRKIPI